MIINKKDFFYVSGQRYITVFSRTISGILLDFVVYKKTDNIYNKAVMSYWKMSNRISELQKSFLTP